MTLGWALPTITAHQQRRLLADHSISHRCPAFPHFGGELPQKAPAGARIAQTSPAQLPHPPHSPPPGHAATPLSPLPARFLPRRLPHTPDTAH